MGVKKFKKVKFKIGDYVIFNAEGLRMFDDDPGRLGIYGPEKKHNLKGNSIVGIVVDIENDKNTYYAPIYTVDWYKKNCLSKCISQRGFSVFSEDFFKIDRQTTKKAIVESGLLITVLINA